MHNCFVWRWSRNGKSRKDKILLSLEKKQKNTVQAHEKLSDMYEETFELWQFANRSYNFSFLSKEVRTLKNGQRWSKKTIGIYCLMKLSFLVTKFAFHSAHIRKVKAGFDRSNILNLLAFQDSVAKISIFIGDRIGEGSKIYAGISTAFRQHGGYGTWPSEVSPLDLLRLFLSQMLNKSHNPLLFNWRTK